MYKDNNFRFSQNTTYGLGGYAKAAYYPESISELTAVFNCLSGHGERFVVLGNGSDVLASDAGFDGSVICTKCLRGIYKTEENTLYCLAGTPVGVLLNYCKDNGFSGLEYLAGIPATIGGVAYMNGGACGKYISSNITTVHYFDGKIHSFSNNQCKFGYKYSIMRDIIGVITGVELKICPETPEIIRQNIAEVLNGRSWHPKGKSCGCVFKNPIGLSAGKLIDECGLKGVSIGGAFVSDKHANFILNDNGTSSDVKRLIDKVKNTVFEKTGILLEEEVVYIGDFK